MGLQAKCSQPIQSAFYKVFYNWGSFVGRKPKLVIFASTVLCVLGAIRLPLAIAFPLESVVEQDQLWVPQEAQALRLGLSGTLTMTRTTGELSECGGKPNASARWR